MIDNEISYLIGICSRRWRLRHYRLHGNEARWGLIQYIFDTCTDEGRPTDAILTQEVMEKFLRAAYEDNAKMKMTRMYVYEEPKKEL